MNTQVIKKSNAKLSLARLSAQTLFESFNSLSSITTEDVLQILTDKAETPVFVRQEFIKQLNKIQDIYKPFFEVYDPTSKDMRSFVYECLMNLYRNKPHTVLNFKTDNKSLKNTISWIANNFKIIANNDIKSVTKYTVRNIAEQQFIALYDTKSPHYEQDLKEYFNCHDSIDNNSNLILYATSKGVGKSTTIYNYIQQFKEAGFETANNEVSLPQGGFNNGSEFSEYSLLRLSEIQKELKYSESTIMNIGRREDYSYEKKFEMKTYLKAIARWMTSTNYNLGKMFNDRTILTVNTIPAKYSIIDKNFGKIDYDQNINIFKTDIKRLQRFYDLLIEEDESDLAFSTEKEENKPDIALLKSLFNDEQLYLFSKITSIISQLDYVHEDAFSVASIMKHLKAQGEDILDNYYNEKTLLEMIQTLYSKNVITRANTNSGKYCKYHFGNLLNLKEEDIEGKLTDISVEDEIKEARKTWDRIIELAKKVDTEFDNKPTDPRPTDRLEFTKDDIKTTHMFVCDNQYSQPSSDIKDTTQFIITAEPTKEYISSKPEQLDRKGEHYRPTCFVYEMDETPLEEQKKIFDDLKERISDNIYSITYSGGKSIHTLVWIKPEDRDEVKKDFKWYWTETAKELFGNNWEKLDKADASIARLSRRPGAIRDNGELQECYYLNKNVKGIILSNLIQRKKELDRKQKYQQKIEEELRKQKQLSFSFDNKNERPLIEQLKDIANKSSSESVKLAYEILESGNAESGSNMIGAIGAMKKLAENDSKWYELGQQLVDICHSQHPSNISFKNF